MSKQVLIALWLFLWGTIISAGPIIISDVSSETAKIFVAKVEASVTRDRLGLPVDDPNFTLYFNIQEHQNFMAPDSLKTLVSVVWGFGKQEIDEDFIMRHTLNGTVYYRYSPIKTLVAQMDATDPHSADVAIEQLLAQITGFFEGLKLSPEQEFNSRKDYIKHELETYGSYILQWYLTPSSQGGAGQNIEPNAKTALASFMGFDTGDFSYLDESINTRYVISSISADKVVITASLANSSNREGQVVKAHVDFATREIDTEVTKGYTYDEKSLSSEAQIAISSLRKVYDVYYQTNGTTEDLTMDRALQEARIGERTLQNWTFEVEGQPPTIFRAVSTKDFPAGAGKQVWYNVRDAKFHGFGTD